MNEMETQEYRSDPEEAQKTLGVLAHQALDDCPIFVDHICQTMAQCTEKLQAGDDTEGLSAFARGASDLGEFLKLVDQLTSISNASNEVAIKEYRTQIHDCVVGMEKSMKQMDLVALSDDIEGGLLPLLPKWDAVAEEVRQSLTAAQ